jgi:hypothetical protein
MVKETVAMHEFTDTTAVEMPAYIVQAAAEPAGKSRKQQESISTCNVT